MLFALLSFGLLRPALHPAWRSSTSMMCASDHSNHMQQQVADGSLHELEDGCLHEVSKWGAPRTLELQQNFASLYELRRTEFISFELMRKIGRTNFNSPTFKKLFTHDTWSDYTGVAPWDRWKNTIVGWNGSSILRAVLSRTVFTAAWAAFVVLLGRRLPMSPIALQLQGTAIGLLLVFRNNNAFQRLAEARALMGKIILLGREIASGATTYVESDARDGQPTEAAYLVCRYMAIFGWVVKARLRDGEVRPRKALTARTTSLACRPSATRHRHRHCATRRVSHRWPLPCERVCAMLRRPPM